MQHFELTVDKKQLTKFSSKLSIAYCQLSYDAKLICHYTSIES
jgi:hypothetical protein